MQHQSETDLRHHRTCELSYSIQNPTKFSTTVAEYAVIFVTFQSLRSGRITVRQQRTWAPTPPQLVVRVSRLSCS